MPINKTVSKNQMPRLSRGISLAGRALVWYNSKKR
jgi:hypothetical protein